MKLQNCLWQALLAVMVILSSCSGDDAKTSSLLDQVPASVDLVVFGNINTIVKSAGGTIENNQIKLPSDLLDAIELDTDELDEFNDAIKEKGLDPSAMALTLNFKDNEPIIVFVIDDKSKLQKYLDDEDYSEKSSDGGVKVYAKKTYESSYSSEYDSYSYVAIKGNYMYLMSGVANYKDIKPVRVFERYFSDLKDKPFSKTKFGQYISSGNAGGVCVTIPKEVRREIKMSGVICAKVSLDGNKLSVEGKWYDEDGKEQSIEDLGFPMDLSAKVDSKALKYLGAKQQMVYAVALKDVDWDKIVDKYTDMMYLSKSERMVAYAVVPYLKKLDGTAAIGLGLKNGIDAVEYGNPADEISGTLVIQTKSGQAKQLIKDMMDILDEQRIDFDKTSDGFEIDIEGVNIYAKADGDFLVFSNSKIEKSNDNPCVKAFDFGKSFAGLALCINKDDMIMKDLGVKYDVQGFATANLDKAEASGLCQIKGGSDKGFVALMIELGKAISEKTMEYEMKYYVHDEYDGWDDDVVEEVVTLDDYEYADSAVAE